MKKKILITALITAICLLAAVPALAADVFRYTERSIRIFEDEEATPEIEQDGKYAGGEIVFSSSNPKAATVSAAGTITPVSKGKTTITAQLVQDGKNIRRTTIEVTVVRRVTKVTLSRKKLIVMEPDDPLIAGLLKDPADDPDPDAYPDGYAELPVIVVPTGRNYTLNAACTPEDANNTKVSFATTDVGIAKINGGTTLRGVQTGECLLTVSSVQNPEITETFRVLVVEPVKKIKIESPAKAIFVGESMEMDAVFTPETASIRKVVWTSRRPSVATIDQNGVVTGVAKGQATIEAKSMDGTEVVATFTLNVEQDATEITVKPTEVTVATKRRTQVTATVLPKEANNRKVKWVSSDESIATVRNGEITGVKAGGCVVTAISESNPGVQASVQVTVVQPVTKITFTNAGKVSLPVRTSTQLYWTVEPADASIKDVTFKSSNTGIATVDANGVVTGIKRGTVTITATATDGSKKTGTIKVEVIQPAEGVTMERGLYYVPIGRGTNIKAQVLPSDANNKNVFWEVGDPSIATIRSNGTSTGRATGVRSGTTTVTAITEDGGFTATAAIQVADYDGAIRVEGLEITPDNRIRISLYNASDLMIEKVYFHVSCFDTQNYPMVYNRDGVTPGFDGEYPLPLYPNERTTHGQFNFGNYLDTGTLGAITLTVTGYRFDNGQVWEIPEEYRISTPVYSQRMWEPTPAPLVPEETPAP